MCRRLAPIVFSLALLAAAPAASAQEPSAANAKDGKLNLKILSGLGHAGKRYLAEGQLVKVQGRVRPYVKGQHVTVAVKRPGRTVLRRRMKLGKARGRNAGQFKLSFVAGTQAVYTVRVRHRRTPGQGFFYAKKSRRALDNTASFGSTGIRVRLLQKGLRRLGYAGLTASGYFGPGSSRAVLAFRKVNGLGRSSYASTEVFKRVFQGRGTFRLKYPNAGRHVEADLSRQVLVLADDGKAERIYHTSSGKPSTPTVLGHFNFYRKSPGTNSHGMVHSSYFIGGYAIHGYHSVPLYAASHGCLRVPVPNARAIYDWIDFGDDIYVYR
jgi:L,D-transpeptidase catalytic domain/Putative peptidoglycan binding domain